MDEMQRPNDQRNFIHKKILGLGRTALGFVGASGIPGFSQGARLASSFLRGGSRNQRFLTARANQLARGTQASRFPAGRGGNALEQVVAARQGIRANLGTGSGNGVCGSCCAADGTKAGHTNKTGYYVQSVPGSPESGGTWVARGTVCVSNRRRNFFNGRANSHSLTRLTGWARNTKKLRKAVKALEMASR